MYAWIWRHLPFRRWYLRLGLALALIVGAGALLWYVVFPLVEPLAPFDDVQVTNDGGPGDHDLPYSTEEPTSPTSTGLPR
jgi:hypothetical protein